MADYLKQSRTDIVIEIFGRKFFLPVAGKACSNVGGKFVGYIGGDCMNEHLADSFDRIQFIGVSRSEIPRKRIGNAPGTSCEMSDAACKRPCVANRPS